MAESHTGGIDFTNRDPKHINEAVKVNFDDVIAESSATHSLDVVWKASYFTFTVSKNWFYCSLTAIFAIPLSLLWGLLCALMSFWHIWIVMPCINSFMTGFHWLSRPYLLVLHTFFHPLFESMGKIYSSVKVVLHKEV